MSNEDFVEVDWDSPKCGKRGKLSIKKRFFTIK